MVSTGWRRNKPYIVHTVEGKKKASLFCYSEDKYSTFMTSEALCWKQNFPKQKNNSEPIFFRPLCFDFFPWFVKKTKHVEVHRKCSPFETGDLDFLEHVNICETMCHDVNEQESGFVKNPCLVKRTWCSVLHRVTLRESGCRAM